MILYLEISWVLETAHVPCHLSPAWGSYSYYARVWTEWRGNLVWYGQELWKKFRHGNKKIWGVEVHRSLIFIMCIFLMWFLLKVFVQMHLFIFQWSYRIQYGIMHFALFIEQVRCICVHVHNMTWFCGHGEHGTHKSVWHDMSLFPGAITSQDKAA